MCDSITPIFIADDACVDNTHWVKYSSNGVYGIRDQSPPCYHHAIIIGSPGTDHAPRASLDDVVHEFAHIFSFQTWHTSSVNTADDKLAEACADIWAAIITHEIYPNDEDKIWKIGEDVVLPNSGYSCIRNLAVPNDPTAEMQMDTCICQSSGGSAYQQSGIISHWFYLLTHGFSGKGCDGKCYAFPAVPIDSAAKLMYYCEKYHFHEGMDFSDIVSATVEASVVFSNPVEMRLSICGAWNVVGASTCDSDNNLGIAQYGLSFDNVNSDDYYVSSNIVIDSLQTLNLTGTIHMNDSCRIIVRPGGKLIVNGGTITNACEGEMWQGIIVEGNASIRQAALAQGSVILTNATIENARDAICTMGSNPDSVFEHTGGIIQATNTLLRNNRRSVAFLSYENHTTGGAVMDNASYFTRCTFTVDSNNLFAQNGTSFNSHVTMWHVRGVKFNGCTFRNETANHGGKAIYTEEAGFTAKRVCPQMSNLDPCVCNANGNDTVTRCSFSGFHTAVHSANGHASYAVTLDNCDFSDNRTGVTLNAADNAQVSFCDFDLSAPASLYGLYLKNSTGYTVESNSLHSEPYTNSPSATGISVVHSGTAENVIRKNVFRNLMYGCLAQDTNGTTLNVKPQPGLQFQCNDFQDCSYDIAVANGRIRSAQGSASAGADNTFRYAIQGSFLLSNAGSFTYWYSSTGYHAPYNTPTPGVTLKGTASANSCTSTLCGLTPLYPRDGLTALEQYLSMAEEYAALVETLHGVETCHGASLQTDATNPQDETDNADPIARLSDLSAQMGDLARAEIRNILNDSVPDMALLKEWYQAITAAAPAAGDIPVSAYQLAEVYSEEGDLSAARTLLSALPQQFSPDEAARNEYANYMALQQLRETVAGNWYTMTDTDIAAMQRVAEYDNGRAARMAKEILCFFHHICYEDDPLLELDGIGERALRGDGACPTATTNDGTLRLHPNPTGGTLTVETTSPIRTLTVYDLAGRVMMTAEGGANDYSPLRIMDVSSLPNGIYLLRAVTDNGVETGRFVKN